LDGYSDFIEGNLDRLRQTSHLLGESNIAFVERLELETDSAINQVLAFRHVVEGFRQATASGRKGAQSFRNSVVGLRRKNVSQALNRASDRLGTALDGIIACMEDIEHSCDKLLSTIDDKVQPSRQTTARQTIRNEGEPANQNSNQAVRQGTQTEPAIQPVCAPRHLVGTGSVSLMLDVEEGWITDIECVVQDPEGTATATKQAGVFGPGSVMSPVTARYPEDFAGARPLRTGSYGITWRTPRSWAATSLGMRTVARDSFTVE
jgi:hypothetical protein